MCAWTRSVPGDLRRPLSALHAAIYRYLLLSKVALSLCCSILCALPPASTLVAAVPWARAPSQHSRTSLPLPPIPQATGSLVPRRVQTHVHFCQSPSLSLSLRPPRSIHLHLHRHIHLCPSLTPTSAPARRRRRVPPTRLPTPRPPQQPQQPPSTIARTAA